MTDLSEGDLVDVFADPEGYAQEIGRDPVVCQYVRRRKDVSESKKVLSLTVVGSHPLWGGGRIWNASIAMADLLDSDSFDCNEKSFVEFGAGSGLPSIIAGLRGARTVVCSDYPDSELIENIQRNLKSIDAREGFGSRVRAAGYCWGEDLTELKELLGSQRADVILLSDVIFNHSEHEKLIVTCKKLLARDGLVIITFSHHTPRLKQKDLHFFDECSRLGLKWNNFSDRRMTVMFEGDEGDVEDRATVHFYSLAFEDRFLWPLMKSDEILG